MPMSFAGLRPPVAHRFLGGVSLARDATNSASDLMQHEVDENKLLHESHLADI